MNYFINRFGDLVLIQENQHYIITGVTKGIENLILI